MYTITEYTQADLRNAIQLIAQLQDYLKELEPEIIASGEKVADSYMQYLLDKACQNRGNIFIAKKMNQAIGLAAVRVKKDKDEDIECLYISDLIVTQSERNKGVGSQLLQRIERYAKKQGIYHLKIGALVLNGGSIKLYKKLGFRDYGVALYKKLND